MYGTRREGRALYQVGRGESRYGFEVESGRYDSEFHQYAKREIGKLQL